MTILEEVFTDIAWISAGMVSLSWTEVISVGIRDASVMSMSCSYIVHMQMPEYFDFSKLVITCCYIQCSWSML